MLAEDTRHTRGLLARHGIEARLLSYHEHNEAARVGRASCPGPRPASASRSSRSRAAGSPTPARVSCVRRSTRSPGDGAPRALAVETALVASGLAATVRVRRLPAAARRRARGALARARRWSWPTVAFESPKRLPATPLPGVRRRGEDVAVCRELTKRFEEVVCGRRPSSRRGSPAPERGGDARHRRCQRPAGRDRGPRGRVRSGRRRHAATGRRRGRLPPDRPLEKRPLSRHSVTTL